MSEVMRPCLDCGELSTQSRCQDHRREQRQAKEQRYIEQHGHRRERLAGHGTTEWIRLSKRARKMQEFCMDCRRTEQELRAVGERLEADHLPSAWHKHSQGKALSLNDIEVVCGQCNRARGSSRPGTKRYIEWLETGHDRTRAVPAGNTSNQGRNVDNSHDGGSD